MQRDSRLMPSGSRGAESERSNVVLDTRRHWASQELHQRFETPVRPESSVSNLSDFKSQVSGGVSLSAYNSSFHGHHVDSQNSFKASPRALVAYEEPLIPAAVAIDTPGKLLKPGTTPLDPMASFGHGAKQYTPADQAAQQSGRGYEVQPYGNPAASIHNASLKDIILSGVLSKGEPHEIDSQQPSLGRGRGTSGHRGDASFHNGDAFTRPGINHQMRPSLGNGMHFAGDTTPVPSKRTLRGLTGSETIPDPDWLEQTEWGYKPSLGQALMASPFIVPTDGLKPCPLGVLRFIEPPFAITKSEILSALGRHAQVAHQPIGSPYFAIHIIVERDSGKTMDVFVEVSSRQEAINIFNQFQLRVQRGRTLTLGKREAVLDLSSQEELMKNLFPRAKNVEWTGNTPTIIPDHPEYYHGVKAVGFDGFVSGEEMAILMKFLETPQRSPFAARSQSRPYECLISTIQKYPIHAPHATTLADRKRIFDATNLGIRSLASTLRRQEMPPNTALTPALLQELVVAALGSPLLSECQKSTVVSVLETYGYGAMAMLQGTSVRLGGTHEYAAQWPLLALVKKPNVSSRLMRFYANAIREATTADLGRMTMGEIAAVYASGRHPGAIEPFGTVNIDYGASGADMGRLSLAFCAMKEFEYVAQLLQSGLSFDGNASTNAATTWPPWS